MYSWQIDQFLASRSYSLTPQEYEYVTDLKESPQINRITYRPYSDDFFIATKDGMNWIIRIKK